MRLAVIVKPIAPVSSVGNVQIRGAPAIGSLAALSVASYISTSLVEEPRPDFLSSPLRFSNHIKPLLDHLFLARPTAVNLGAALDQIRKVLDAGVQANSPVEQIAREVIETGRAVHEIDLGQNRAMGNWGGGWIVEAVKKSGGSGEGLNLLTVCNTGSLATSVSFPIDVKHGGVDTDRVTVMSRVTEPPLEL